MQDYLQINKLDNVSVVLNEKTDIPFGHKIAIKDILKGDNVIKYGSPIGHAKEFIAKGQWVHSHNLETNLKGIIDYEYNFNGDKTIVAQSEHQLCAYRRKTGEIGIRNEIWVLVMVGCLNSVAKEIVRQFNESNPKTENYDGAYTITHPFGCSQIGDDLNYTRALLQKIAKHPNAGGVLVLSLGCENNKLSDFKSTLGSYDDNRIKFLVAQESNDEIKDALILLDELKENMKDDKRQEVLFSDLCFGLKCGGSDAFSGITANPLVGLLSDKLVSCGSKIIMSEVPEMFGAEQILMNRCKDTETFNKLVDCINKFKNYFSSNNMPIYENPAPGNKDGGITTLEEKSLGCIQKCGSSIINDVIDYAQTAKEKGISLLYGPGNDLVSTTALAASGANLLLFTTGRGTPFSSFVPTIKISTNNNLYEKKNSWIDFNAGSILNGESIEILSEELLKLVVDVINGKATKGEAYNDREISIFKQGVTV